MTRRTDATCQQTASWPHGKRPKKRALARETGEMGLVKGPERAQETTTVQRIGLYSLIAVPGRAGRADRRAGPCSNRVSVSLSLCLSFVLPLDVPPGPCSYRARARTHTRPCMRAERARARSLAHTRARTHTHTQKKKKSCRPPEQLQTYKYTLLILLTHNTL